LSPGGKKIKKLREKVQKGGKGGCGENPHMKINADRKGQRGDVLLWEEEGGKMKEIKRPEGGRGSARFIGTSSNRGKRKRNQKAKIKGGMCW